MRLNERCTALVAVLTLLLLLDSSWAQKQHPEKPPKKQKPISDPHYKYKKQQDEYYGSHGGYAGYGQQHGGGYGQPYHGGYQQPYPSSKQPYRQDPYKGDHAKGPYKQQGYYKDSYGYDSYDSYGKKHKKKEKDEPTLSTSVDFIIDKCSLRYPGVAIDTWTVPQNTTPSEGQLLAFISRPSTVVGWWSMHCRPSDNMKEQDKDYGYDKGYYADEESSSSSGNYNDTSSGADYDYGYSKGGGGDIVHDVGKCWYSGVTDYGILYKYDKEGPANMGTLITFICKLDKTRAKKCDPGFKPVNNGDKVYFGGHGRVGISYIYKAASAMMPADVSHFDIKSGGVEPEDLLITGFVNGEADALHPNLPLTRYNVGLAQLELSQCENKNEPWPDGSMSSPPGPVSQVSNDMGKGTFTVELTI